MTFYNHIESARYEMFKLVNGWTREGAETKARISESLDQARREYMEMEAENARLREENERFIIKLNAEHIVRQNVESENVKLRELVRGLIYATHPADRARLIADAPELMAELMEVDA